ncbi:18971_t:CDS:1 [Funneliformis geosporum]|nr:18971_t:CDS:1 [Funneliformis geosporum]
MLKQENERTGNTEEVEPPYFDMNFDFEDAPPATVIDFDDKKKDNENKKEVQNRTTVRKVKSPKPVRKISNKSQVKSSKDKQRVKKNLRIDMVGYDQKPDYTIRSHSNKRRKASE